MQKYSDTVLDANGNVVVGATVTVTNYVGGASATVYGTNAVGANVNPLTTDSRGYFEFWAANGAYTLTISKSGITTRTVSNVIIRETEVSALEYGVVADGVTDNATALANAIAAAQAVGAGTRLLLPRGTVCTTAVQAVSTTPIRIEGEGGMSATAYSPLGATVGTTIKYTGNATASPVLTFSGFQSPHGLKGVYIDGNSLADVGLKVDSVCYGRYEDILITGAKVRSMIVQNTSTTSASTSWNLFSQINITVTGASGVCGLYVTGSSNTNVCHCTFEGFRINHDTSANGVDLGYCDNNRFIGFYINRSSGTGAGVNVIDTEHAGFPQGNVFVHLQAGNGGWVQQATSNAWNTVLGYDKYNGQPDPTTNNKPLLVLNGYGTFNTLVAGTAGAAGGADIRTVLAASTGAAPNAAAIQVGYQGTSANYLDANTHHFRDGNSANDVTIAAGAMTVPGLLTVTGGQIKFPATQVPSADVNTLDDYEEGIWTPVLTFATPGTLAVTYSVQTGEYTKVGRDVRISCSIITSGFTLGTASGNLQITGLPFAPAGATNQANLGALSWSGITKAGYTQVVARALAGNGLVDFLASGSGQAVSAVTATDTPSGGTVRIEFTLTYHI